MKKTIARAAVLAVVATGLSFGLVSPALAAPEGLRCRFTSITDPTVEGDVQVGQVNAGPITGGGDIGDVQITCTIQVNVGTHGGGGASVSSAATPGAAAIPPSQISYVSPEGSIVYMCTKVTIGGQNWYWNSAGGVPESGTWSTSAGGPCSTAISQELPNGEEVDPILCPVLAELASVFPSNGPLAALIYIKSAAESPNGGDVYVNGVLFWDCPVYEA